MNATMNKQSLNYFGVRLQRIARIVSPSDRKTRSLKKFEIITGSRLRIWYLTKFAGYEITSLTWAPKRSGGFRIRKRLVRVDVFPLVLKPYRAAPRAKKSRAKSLRGIMAYARRVL